MKMNSSEWYLIMCGCIGSLINGGMMPAFAVIFAEILGVGINIKIKLKKSQGTK